MNTLILQLEADIERYKSEIRKYEACMQQAMKDIERIERTIRLTTPL